MSDFRKPRPDYPIYPSTGYYRKKAQVFKRPKGRRGRKPKGQKVGNFVRYQDPMYNIIKAEDEARKARELAIAQAKEQEQYRQLQIQDIEDKRADRQEEIQIRRDEAQARQDEAQARQDEAQARIDETRQLRLESDRREQRLIEDRREIEAQFVRLYEAQERRMGENLEIFERAFKAIADRRPVDFREVKAQEQTDLKLSPEERRDRRGRSDSVDTAVNAGFESLATTPKGRQRTPSPERERQVKQVLATQQQQFQPKPQPEPETESPDLPEEEGFGGGHRTRGAERRQKPKRFEGGATTPELAAAGGIEGQTPASQQRGGSGSKETTRRGKNSGKEETPVIGAKQTVSQTPVIGGSRERLEQLQRAEQVKKEVAGVKLSPATTGGLTESQLSRDFDAIAQGVETRAAQRKKKEGKKRRESASPTLDYQLQQALKKKFDD